MLRQRNGHNGLDPVWYVASFSFFIILLSFQKFLGLKVKKLRFLFSWQLVYFRAFWIHDFQNPQRNQMVRFWLLNICSCTRMKICQSRLKLLPNSKKILNNDQRFLKFCQSCIIVHKSGHIVSQESSLNEFELLTSILHPMLVLTFLTW